MPLNLGQRRTGERGTSRLGLGGWSRPEPMGIEPLDDELSVEEADGISPRQALAGAAAGIGGLALASKFLPGRLGKIAGGLNTLRQQLMLSGLAPVKSVIGNIGAAAEAGFETRSLRPLRELFSRQTARDAIDAYKRGGLSSGTEGIDQASVHGPGRFMGALDEATQGALKRLGFSAENAAARTLQAPLPERLAKVLDNPAARYVQPFRRTPFNQFFEGMERLPGSDYSKAHPFITAGYTGAGMLHGAARADEPFPVDIGLGTAAASRQGMNYAIGALLGRYLSGGNINLDSSVGNVLPVSEYGFESSLTDPLRPFRRPALWSLLDEEDLF